MRGFAELFGLRTRLHLRKLGRTWKFGMTSRPEQRWLRNYAAQRYCGVGAIVDLGCFLGATTIALAEGLVLNRKANRKQIHAYDLFIWNKRYEAWARGKEVEGLFTIGGSFLPEFLRRTQNWRDFIVIHEEDLRHACWEHGPIEFLFIDAMKSPEVATAIASNFFFAPGPCQKLCRSSGLSALFRPVDPLSDISASRLLQIRCGSSAIEPFSSRERNRTTGLGARFITGCSFTGRNRSCL